jgi:hypothetical protein
MCQEIWKTFDTRLEARGSALAWVTVLQAGRSRVRIPMVSLEIFHWYNPSGFNMASQTLTKKEYQEHFLADKGCRCLGWQPYRIHVPIVLKSGTFNHVVQLRTCPGLYRDCLFLIQDFTLTSIIFVELDKINVDTWLIYLFTVHQLIWLNYTGCPTRYRTRHFFNNFTTNEDIATKFEAELHIH